MRTQSRLALTLIAGLLAGAVMAADKPVATVNGVAIPQAKMDFILKKLAERGAKDSPDLRQKIRDDLILKEVLSQEATKQGVDKQSDTQMEMDISRQNALLNAFVAHYQKNNPMPDAELKAEFDKMKTQMPPKEYQARHILVEKEDEAKAILAALKKGKKFEDLAKEKSKDPGSKDKGGDLGWSVPDSFVPEFGQAMTKLKKGQITQEPVKTQFGYHIIKLEDERAMQGPSFEEMKPQLQQQAQGKQIQKMIDDLKAKAKID